MGCCLLVQCMHHVITAFQAAQHEVLSAGGVNALCHQDELTVTQAAQHGWLSPSKLAQCLLGNSLQQGSCVCLIPRRKR